MATYDANVLSFAAFPEIISANKQVDFYSVYNSSTLPSEQFEEIMRVRYHFIFQIYKIANLVSNTIIRNFRI